MIRKLVVLAIGIALVVAVQAATKAKPAANPTATVGFSGRAGDGLLGDTLGSYVGGVSGVVAELQPNGNTPAWSGFANLLINITTTGGRSKRYFVFNYPSAIDAGCQQFVTGPSPTRTNAQTSSYLNIHSIGAIAIGEVRAVKAFVGSPDGEMGYTNDGSGGLCSSPVAVYRPSWNTWTVSTDVTRLGLPNYTLPGIQSCQTDGNGQVTSCSIMTYRGVDDWAANNGGTVWRTPMGLDQLGFQTTFVGNYLMPFALTVTTTDTRMKTNYVTCSLNGQPLATGCSFPY